MKCKRVSNLLSEYIAEELPVAQMVEIDSHIARCVDCRHELRVFTNATVALQQAVSVHKAPDVLATVKQRAVFTNTHRRPWRPVYSFGVALVVVALFAGFILPPMPHDMHKPGAASGSSKAVKPVNSAPPAAESVRTVSVTMAPRKPPVRHKRAVKAPVTGPSLKQVVSVEDVDISVVDAEDYDAARKAAVSDWSASVPMAQMPAAFEKDPDVTVAQSAGPYRDLLRPLDNLMRMEQSSDGTSGLTDGVPY